MKVAVFDTRVVRPDGRIMHFDILVRDDEDSRSPGIVLAHGREYLAAKGVPEERLATLECLFCHGEPASPAVESEIERYGFAIIELQNCD